MQKPALLRTPEKLTFSRTVILGACEVPKPDAAQKLSLAMRYEAQTIQAGHEYRDFLQAISCNFAESRRHVVGEPALRMGALSAAPLVRRPARTQAYGCKALDDAVLLKLIRTNCSPQYRIHCIAKACWDPQKSQSRIISSRRGAFVFDVQLVRTLCQEITEEKDPPRVEELLHLLQAVIRDDQEEVRLRMSFLTRKYAAVVSDSKAAD